MNYETILLELEGAIAVLTINRPDKLNALNGSCLTEIDNAIKFIETNTDIRGLIITGAGEKSFVAGADISELHNCDLETGKAFSEFGNSVFRRIELLNIPVIAAINGFALGGGCELAMACHIRYASENAKFGQPETNLGIIPGYGGTQRLPLIVGLAKAYELILSGEIINATRALEIGLINKIFTKDELIAKCKEFLNITFAKSKESIKASIECIRASEKLTLEEGLAFEAKVFGEVCGTSNFKEGTKAYLEKRPANFE